MGTVEPTRGLKHIPALDGLRGLAVAGVLCFHGGLAWVGGGFLGVSTFFTLSGFLITGLLLTEKESTSRIDLGHFWSDRLRRLLPAALACLAGVVVYGAVIAKGQQADRLVGDIMSALGYVANWRFVLGDASYSALFADPSPVQHFWSLAIEEQFYLIYPLFAAGALILVRGSRALYASLLGALALGSTTVMWLLFTPGADSARVYYGTDTRAAELLIGALLATLIVGRNRFTSKLANFTIATAGTLALAALTAAWLFVDLRDTFLYRGGLPIHAVLVAIVIFAATRTGPVTTILSLRPLRALGLISYGAYLYHWPIFLWLSPERTGLAEAPLFALRIAITISLATLSYYFLELPIRRGKRITGWQPVILAPLGAALVAGALIAVPIGTDAPDIVFAAVREPAAAFADMMPTTTTSTTTTTTTTLPAPTPTPFFGIPTPAPFFGQPAAPITPPAAPGTPFFGVPTPAPFFGVPSAAPAPPPAPVLPAPPPPPPVQRIMVVGDSVSQTLGRGIERWGARNAVDVFNGATYWCPIARGGRLAGQYGTEQGEGCTNWATRWARQLDAFQPDVVVVLTTFWDIGDRQRDVWGPDFVKPSDSRLENWVVSEWRAAVDLLSSRGAVVVWLSPPCMRDNNVNTIMEAQYPKMLARLHNTRSTVPIDLKRYVCPTGAFSTTVDGVDGARPDGTHFSDPGADVVAAWLGPRLTDRNDRGDLLRIAHVKRF